MSKIKVGSRRRIEISNRRPQRRRHVAADVSIAADLVSVDVKLTFPSTDRSRRRPKNSFSTHTIVRTTTRYWQAVASAASTTGVSCCATLTHAARYTANYSNDMSWATPCCLITGSCESVIIALRTAVEMGETKIYSVYKAIIVSLPR